MMNVSKIALRLAAFSLIGFCALSFAKEKHQPLTNCASINWADKGKEDAIAGLPFTKIDEYTVDCKAENVVPGDKLYVSGYLKGLEIYCTADRGYQLGRTGGASDRYCAKTEVYMTAFEKGQKEFTERVEREKIERLTRPRSGGGFGPNVATPNGTPN
ncbi:DUF2799 domain-containing protein [Cellvibrio sp.]|uniref:DUF2799 domain-containing protein n=1 Tax=Cellvibrio sp. TaxID=1965322 RepID=UPI0039648304